MILQNTNCNILCTMDILKIKECQMCILLKQYIYVWYVWRMYYSLIILYQINNTYITQFICEESQCLFLN